MKSEGITVIIVSRGLESLLRFCLEGLERALRRLVNSKDHQVVVVDNATSPPYVEETYRNQGVEMVRFDIPQSFARANNTAALRYGNDYYLLLNNDVFLAKDALVGMADLLAGEPSVGICGGRMVFPDATIQHCGVVFGPGKQGPYHCHRNRPSQTVSRENREFQAVTGACMLVRSDLWKALGGLDERYPFGLEDIDFCLRARRAGWRVMCHNTVDSLHFEASTPGRQKLDVP